jgi:hypothetical protein
MFTALKKLVGLSSGYDGSLTAEDINFAFVRAGTSISVLFQADFGVPFEPRT